MRANWRELLIALTALACIVIGMTMGPTIIMAGACALASCN